MKDWNKELETMDVWEEPTGNHLDYNKIVETISQVEKQAKEEEAIKHQQQDLNAYQEGVKDTLDKVRTDINDYSSASSRAENEREKGISEGIEMFRRYLLNQLSINKE